MLPALLAAGLLLSSAGPPSPPEARAFPNFVLIRGGELREPVVIHGFASHRFRGIGGVITYGPVATLMSLQDDMLPQPTTPGMVVYEVAEYWRQGGISEKTGRPVAPLRWEGASQYSRLHVMRNGDIL